MVHADLGAAERAESVKKHGSCLTEQKMAIVLRQNPNPLGMFTRVLRHLLQKEALYISFDTIEYLHAATKQFGFNQVHAYEKQSYGRLFITRDDYDVFNKYEVAVDSFHDGFSDVGKAINLKQLSYSFVR